METSEEPEGAEEMEKENSALSVIYVFLTSFVFLPHSYPSASPSCRFLSLFPLSPPFHKFTQKDQT